MQADDAILHVVDIIDPLRIERVFQGASHGVAVVGKEGIGRPFDEAGFAVGCPVLLVIVDDLDAEGGDCSAQVIVRKLLFGLLFKRASETLPGFCHYLGEFSF